MIESYRLVPDHEMFSEKNTVIVKVPENNRTLTAEIFICRADFTLIFFKVAKSLNQRGPSVCTIGSKALV